MESLEATKPLPTSLAEFKVNEPPALPGQKYCIGEMLWAKVGSHPYWPCMVYFGPDSDAICRPHSKGGASRLAYHVQFFGPQVERAWVPDNANLLPYRGKVAYDEYVEEQSFRSKAARAHFEVKPRVQAVWDASWREAELALPLPRHERMFRFGRTYFGAPPAAAPHVAPTTPTMAPPAKPPPSMATPSPKTTSLVARQQPLPSSGGKKPGRKRLSSSSSSITAESAATVQKLPASQQYEQAAVASKPPPPHQPPVPLPSPSLPWQQTRKVSEESSPSSSVASSDFDSASDDNAESSEASSSEENSPAESVAQASFQFQRLKPPPPLGPFVSCPQKPVCGRCELPARHEQNEHRLAACRGGCARLFHFNCLLGHGLCDQCSRKDWFGPVCGLCQLPDKVPADKKPACQMCSRVYHAACLDRLTAAADAAGVNGQLLVRWESETADGGEDGTRGRQLVACPRHACRTCVIDGYPAKQATSGVQVSCVQCPAVYHASKRCLPAGSRALTPSCLVCPDHLLPQQRPAACTGTATRQINVSWCFECSRGGHLICCQRCPAAYHVDCLPPGFYAAAVDEVGGGGFRCPRCCLGWHPSCGHLVWVKVGQFRWWSCEVLLTDHAPVNIQRLGRQPGTFPVRFFGTDEYYWLSRARVFPLAEGDLGEVGTGARSAAAAGETEAQELEVKFREGAAIGQEAWRLRERDKQDARRLLGEYILLGGGACRPQQQQPDALQPVVQSDGCQSAATAAALSHLPRCECQRRGLTCGPRDGCANRMARFECHPGACGPACRNQRLGRPSSSSDQPSLAVFKRPSHSSSSSSSSKRDNGWGVRISSCSRRIAAGQLISEFLGEPVSPAEAARRRQVSLKCRKMGGVGCGGGPRALRLHWRRVLDSESQGNLTRFLGRLERGRGAPNCRLERWAVNGELRVGLFAAGGGVSVGQELLVAGGADAVDGSGGGADVPDGEPGGDEWEMNWECRDELFSTICPACSEPLATCNLSNQRQLFHIRCLDCAARYHAECARQVACADSLDDPAVMSFYCDACLATE